MNVGSRWEPGLARERFDAIVIGSGMGGLGTAATLAQAAGWKVLVLERHYTVGGLTHTFKRRGYEWDVGYDYTPAAELFTKTWDYLSEGRLRWTRMDERYDRLIFPDATYDFAAGKAQWTEDLGKYFPNEREAIARYMRALQDAGETSQGYFTERTLPRAVGTLLYPLLARKFRKLSDQSVIEAVGAMTKDPKLKGVLTARYALYGLPPGQASFGAHALFDELYATGGIYPVGGTASIARAIVPGIESRGGRVIHGVDVESILVHRGKAVGVRLRRGDELHARCVISATGARNTFERLLPTLRETDDIRQRLAQVKPSPGHMAMYLGLRLDGERLELPKAHLWKFPGYEHDRHVGEFFADPSAPFPMVFMSFPSIKGAEDGEPPPSHATAQVLTPAPFAWFEKWKDSKWHRRGDEYDALKQRFMERLLAEVYELVPALRGRVDYQELSTPLSTAHFANYSSGEAYGLELSPLRFQQRWLRTTTPVGNLFLSGQDVITNGASAAALSGVLTASTILRRNLLSKVLAAPSDSKAARQAG